MEADFSGWATKNNLRCADGLTIGDGAFKHNDKIRVPLVWQHQHNDAENVLGHAILENREGGVYTHASFNNSPKALAIKEAVAHGDITMMSIYANNLKKNGSVVTHGNIREVSLVLSGANPGALIENVTIRHGDSFETRDEDEGVIYTGFEISHSALDDDDDDDRTFQDVMDTLDESQQSVIHSVLDAALNQTEDLDGDVVQEVLDSLNDEQQSVVHFMIGEALAHANTQGDTNMADADNKTVKDVFESMSEEQKNVVYFMIGEAVDGDKGEGDSAKQSDSTEFITHAIQEGFNTVSRNVFDQSNNAGEKSAHLSHAQITTIVQDGIKMGSFKESLLAHAGEYGIDNIELLFPDAKNVGNTPELLARQAEWVPKVLGATKHAPFSKIKSIVADITAEEARAKGYIKGTLKKEEVINLLRRTTGPATIYKKQKLDRDDLIDITDFDVVQWLKWEIRFMLNEELARAILVGDGRSTISEDKVKDPIGSNDGTGIRSIANDHELYSIKVELAANISASDTIDAVAMARTDYRGSGNPSWYTTDKQVTKMLLLKDKMGRRLYATMEELAAALRVKEIVAVEVLEDTPDLVGIMVNLVDYTIGTTKGGEMSFFEDFDIDFNQNKYLLETRCSGALTKPKSAIVVRRKQGTLAEPANPSFNGATNTITIPVAAGVDYLINSEIVTGSVVITADTEVEAKPQAEHYFESSATTTWGYTYVAI